MLKPALLYKDEIYKKFAEYMYEDEYFFYSACRDGVLIPEIKSKDCLYQFAIVNKYDKICGYIKYSVDVWNDAVYGFGLYSFDKGNVLIGKDTFELLKTLVKTYRRIEWNCVSGNPAERSYDKFCSLYDGNKVLLHDAIKDKYGNFHDSIIYEIVNKN